MSIIRAIKFFQEATKSIKTVEKLEKDIRDELNELINDGREDLVICVYRIKNECLEVGCWLHKDISRYEIKRPKFEVDLINLSVECIESGEYSEALEIIEDMKNHLSNAVFGEGFIDG